VSVECGDTGLRMTGFVRFAFLFGRGLVCEGMVGFVRGWEVVWDGEGSIEWTIILYNQAVF
jgi:hypothetical protein